MNMKLKHILIAGSLAALSAFEGNSQQTGQFGQFQYNMLEINPAYAGYRETFNLTAINRNQWVGFEGAPVTQTLTFNSPIKGKHIAYGGTIMNDKIGPTNAFSISGDFAWKAPFRDNERSVLSFGLKGSIRYYQADLQNVLIIEEGDLSFLANENSRILPNFSTGAMLSGKTYFLGLSATTLISRKLANPNSDEYHELEAREQSTVYFTGGKIWKLNRQVSIYPAFLLKAQRNAPVSGGAFLNFLIMSDFKIGGYYNFREVAGGLVQWQINRKFRIGYTFEVATSALITTNFGSHEFMLNYAFRKGRTAIIYPKHF